MNVYRVPLPAWAYLIIAILTVATVAWLVANWDGTLGKSRAHREACQTVLGEDGNPKIVCQFPDGARHERSLQSGDGEYPSAPPR